jgi:hypothetical protein
MSTEDFVRSRNVERFERLLKTVTDEAERQQILKLLAEERQKQQDAGDKPDQWEDTKSGS